MLSTQITLREKRVHYPPLAMYLPPVEYSEGDYIVRFALDTEDLDDVLRLRYEVFNLELNEGLDSSHETGRDADEFDPQCHHLIVREKTNSRVVGTYRMQTREMAQTGKGFYSAAEFDLTGLSDSVLNNAVEVGRACIARPHRSLPVLILLWRGLAAYTAHNRKRFIFGCCSLTSQNPAEGRRLMTYLEAHGHTHPTLCVPPQPDYVCDADDLSAKFDVGTNIPRLMKVYLKYGAKVCSPPAIDRRFKTIDYLALIDVQQLDPQTFRYFFG